MVLPIGVFAPTRVRTSLSSRASICVPPLVGNDDGLDAVAGGGVSEGVLDLLERKARGHEPPYPELRHQPEGAAERRTPAERATDPDLAKMNVPQVQRQATALGIDAYELERARGLGQGQGLGDQLRLADGL